MRYYITEIDEKKNAKKSSIEMFRVGRGNLSICIACSGALDLATTGEASCSTDMAGNLLASCIGNLTNGFKVSWLAVWNVGNVNLVARAFHTQGSC